MLSTKIYFLMSFFLIQIFHQIEKKIKILFQKFKSLMKRKNKFKSDLFVKFLSLNFEEKNKLFQRKSKKKITIFSEKSEKIKENSSKNLFSTKKKTWFLKSTNLMIKEYNNLNQLFIKSNNLQNFLFTKKLFQRKNCYFNKCPCILKKNKKKDFYLKTELPIVFESLGY